MRTDPRQASSDRSKSSSDGRSSGRQASEQALDEHDRRPRLPIQLPTPKSSPEPEVLQSPSDLARPSPVDAETALVDRFRKPVSKVSHPACLTPGQRSTTQDAEEAHPNEEQVNNANGPLATRARISDGDSPTLGLAARQLFQQAVPPGFNTKTEFGDFGRGLQPSAAAVGESSRRHRATPAHQRPHWIPTGEGYPSVPSNQWIGSRYPAETSRVPASRRANGRADAVQDESKGALAMEGGVAMRVEVILHGDGYRLRDSRHHPDISQEIIPATPAVSTKADNSEIHLHDGLQAQRSRGSRAQIPSYHSESDADTASISSTECQPSTTASPPSFSPAFSPPPRVSCDIVARNPTPAASQRYFGPENGGRADIDDGEEATVVDFGGNAGANARRRRLSLQMQEWRVWSREPERPEKWSIDFDEVQHRGDER